MFVVVTGLTRFLSVRYSAPPSIRPGGGVPRQPNAMCTNVGANGSMFVRYKLWHMPSHDEPAARGVAVLDEMLRRIIREEVEIAVRRHAAGGAGSEAARRHDSQEWLTLTEAGAQFGFSANTIREWKREGKISGRGSARSLRVNRHSLESFLSGQGGQAPSDEAIAQRAVEIVRGR